jgi:hypothetical protein
MGKSIYLQQNYHFGPLKILVAVDCDTANRS